MFYLRLGALVMVLAMGSTLAVAQPQGERKKRPLPPLQQRESEVRQGGLSGSPAPPSVGKPAGYDGAGGRSFDFNPAGEYAGEYPEVESYTPQPLCEPPDIVNTTGLGPTVSLPTAGDPYWK